MCVVSSADVRAHAVTMFMPEIVTVPVNGRLCDVSTSAAATTAPAGALFGTIGFAGAPRTEPYQTARPPTNLMARLITASRRWKLYRVFNVKDTAMPAEMQSIFAIWGERRPKIPPERSPVHDKGNGTDFAMHTKFY